MNYCKKIALINFFSFLFFFLDRLLKYWIIKNPFEKDFFLIPKILSIKLSYNYGLIFNLPFSQLIFYPLIFVILFVLIIILIRNYFKKNIIYIIALTPIISGALSNIIDRLNYGYVVDYLYLYPLSLFNLADLMIIMGIAYWIVKEIKKA